MSRKSAPAATPFPREAREVVGTLWCDVVEEVLGGHVGSFFEVSDGCGNGGGDPVEPVAFVEQMGLVAAQHLNGILFGVDHVGDCCQVKPHLAQQNDLLQS